MRVIVNSKSDCPWCVKAKAWLDEHLIDYEVWTYDDYDERQALYDALGLVGDQRTVPQVAVIDEGGQRLIGGYAALIASGIEKDAGIAL